MWALIITVPIMALLVAGLQHDPNAAASPLIGRTAPSFVLETLDGHPVTLKQLHGRPVVLNFWASWCIACRVEHPYLVQAWRRYAPHGVVFVGVIYQDTPVDARSFMRQQGGKWFAATDPGQQTAVDYGVGKIPETYFIDRKGVVQFKEAGPLTTAILRSQIERLLASTV